MMMMMILRSNLRQVSFPGQLEHLGLQFAKCWTSGDHNMIEHHRLEDMTIMMWMMRMMMRTDDMDEDEGSSLPGDHKGIYHCGESENDPNR